MRVHLLTSRGLRAHSFTYALRVFARQLKQAGFEVRLFYRDDAPKLTACDVLGVVSDYFGIKQVIARPDDLLQKLKGYRKRVRALVWFDATAGTSALFAPAFEAVDVYAKKQLLRDRTLYKTPYYERGYHLHYYYENYGEQLAALGEKARIVNHRGLEGWEIDRFRLSWNLGLGDYNTLGGRGRSLRPYWPIARFARGGSAASRPDRSMHVSCRVGTKYRFPAVPFHRLEIRRLLKELAQRRDDYTIHCEGRLPYRAYRKELEQACVAPSPFGLGEICWRDFEIFLSGALLLKPDLDHLETWPAYFEKDVTYVAHRWDFADLQEKVEQALDDPARREAIARAGQDRYLASLSRQGGAQFVQRFSDLMEASLRVREPVR